MNNNKLIKDLLNELDELYINRDIIGHKIELTLSTIKALREEV